MKKFIDVLGTQYPVDKLTNITPKILELATRRLYEQRNNPLYLISERIRHFFRDSKLDEVKYDEFTFASPVVSLDENFDSLLIPKDHVSRKQSDTYYVNSQLLFRSHTSAHQAHCLRNNSKAFISIADCYRRDEIDKSHYPVFHQCEVFKLFNTKEVLGDQAQPEQLYDSSNCETPSKQGIYSIEASAFVEYKLKSCIEKFVKNFFDDSDLKTRWVSAYFPFTHPSFELEILWRDKWLEVLGCGVVRNEILKNTGVQDHIGFAAGFGLERFGMLKYEIPDIRLFWTKDSGFLHQFENKSPFDTFKYKSISAFPQNIMDLSFWLLDKQTIFSPNDFYDMCRTIGGDLIEQVRLIDVFTHPKTKKISHCYRLIYRATDRVLTNDEVNKIHRKIAKTCEEEFHVELRM